MSLEVAIARLEEKLDRVIEKLEDQEDHNTRFYDTRDRVNKMEANAKGAWWMLGVMGVMVSAAVSWVVSIFR